MERAPPGWTTMITFESVKEPSLPATYGLAPFGITMLSPLWGVRAAGLPATVQLDAVDYLKSWALPSNVILGLGAATTVTARASRMAIATNGK